MVGTLPQNNIPKKSLNEPNCPKRQYRFFRAIKVCGSKADNDIVKGFETSSMTSKDDPSKLNIEDFIDNPRIVLTDKEWAALQQAFENEEEALKKAKKAFSRPSLFETK